MTSALSGDDSVIVVIVSREGGREGGREGARKSFLRFTAMEDWREGELKQLSIRPSIPRKRTEMEKMEEKELAVAAAESSALVSFKHQCSCRYSRATTVCPRPSPRLPRRVLRWRRERERERERERKEREKYRQWLLGQMSLFRNGDGWINPMSSHAVILMYVRRTTLHCRL